MQNFSHDRNELKFENSSELYKRWRDLVQTFDKSELNLLLDQAENFFEQKSEKTLSDENPLSSEENSESQCISKTQIAPGNEAKEESEDFIKCLEKLIISTNTVDKHLDNLQKLNKEFFDFQKQELKLNAIKQTLESLENALRTSILHKKSIIDTLNNSNEDKIFKLFKELSSLHQKAVKKYENKCETYKQNLNKFNDYKKDFLSIETWLDSILTKINNLEKNNQDKLQEIIKDLTSLTNFRILLEKTNLNGHYIIIRSNEHEAKLLGDKLVDLNHKWKNLMLFINDLREKFLDKNETEETEKNLSSLISKLFNDYNEWLSNFEDFLNQEKNLEDVIELKSFLAELKENETDIVNRKSNFEKESNELSTKLDSFNEASYFNQNAEKVIQNYNKYLNLIRNKITRIENHVEILENFQNEMEKFEESVDEKISDLIKFDQQVVLDLNLQLIDIEKYLNNKNDEIEKLNLNLIDLKHILNHYPKVLDKIDRRFESIIQKWEKLNDVGVSVLTGLRQQKENNNLDNNKQDALKDKNEFKEPFNEPIKSTIVTPYDLENKHDQDLKNLNIIKVEAGETFSDICTSNISSALIFNESEQSSELSKEKKEAENLLHNLSEWLLWINHTVKNHKVTLGDLEEINQAINKFNTIQNEFIKKEEDLRNFLNNQETDLSMLKWKEGIEMVNLRKNELESMLIDCQQLSKLNEHVNNSLNEIERNVDKLDEISFNKETHEVQKLELIKKTILVDELEKTLNQLEDYNQNLLKKYNLEYLDKTKFDYERLTNRFNHVGKKVSNWNEMFNETSRKLNDFDDHLKNFFEWLDKIEKDLNYLEDYCIKSDNSNKQIVIDLYQDLQKEIDSKNNDYNHLKQTSIKILESFKNNSEIENLNSKIEKVDCKWNKLCKNSLEIRSRLESNTSQCSALLNSLNDLILWCQNQQEEIDFKQNNFLPDLNLIYKELNENKVFICNLEYKKPIIESTLASTKSLCLNSANKQVECNEAQALSKKISENIKQLEELWKNLLESSTNFSNFLSEFYLNLQQINKAFENVIQVLNENEPLTTKATSVTSLIENGTENVFTEELDNVKNFQLKISSYQPLIDNMSFEYKKLMHHLEENKYLANKKENFMSELKLIQAKFDDLNLRWTNLQQKIQENYLHLFSLIESSGVNIFLKLVESVQKPWQRVVSAQNKIPYYVNHSSEMTCWDHPKMTELYKSFSNLNNIRFSAYRTAMKLRTLQKRLWFDFVDLKNVIEIFEQNGLKDQNEKNVNTIQIVQYLNKIYHTFNKESVSQFDLVLAIDLALNWLLSVYDPSRCGQIRLLSIKVSIALLSKGSLEDKYIYLFNLIKDKTENCEQRKLALLLYEMIMIPKQLGEVAAFGGSNVEPSVRSCFEFAKNPSLINLQQFLGWLKLEPQSIVWLPVLHRLTVAETAKHDAKCSICKEYPIVGFRYRSLKHFNFDICQSCFFSGRKIKGFKFDHPLLEYYIQTSSSDDIKDFFKIFRNKFRSKRARRSSKLGYLPVQSIIEVEDQSAKSTDKLSTHNTPTREIITKIEPQERVQSELKYDDLSTKIEQNNININTTNYQQKRTEIFENNFLLRDDSQNVSYQTILNEQNYSTTKFNYLDEEHYLIAKICNSLNTANKTNFQTETPKILPKSELLIEPNQQQELEDIINDLEEENIFLMEEYKRLQNQLNARLDSSIKSIEVDKSSKNKQRVISSNEITPSLSIDIHSSRALSSSPTFNLSESIPTLNRRCNNTADIMNNMSGYHSSLSRMSYNTSSSYLRKETCKLVETKQLKQDEEKLEARMKILENHNRLLGSQLIHLRSLLNNNNNTNNTHQASSLKSKPVKDSILLKNNSFYIQDLNKEKSSTNIVELFNNVEDITKAINNLNNLVNGIGNSDSY